MYDNSLLKAVAFSFLALVFPPLSAQEQGSPQFEVASVKRFPPESRPKLPLTWHPPRQGGRYEMDGTTLRVAIQTAYALLPFRVLTPDWVESERYHIVATMPLETTNSQVL